MHIIYICSLVYMHYPYLDCLSKDVLGLEDIKRQFQYPKSYNEKEVVHLPPRPDKLPFDPFYWKSYCIFSVIYPPNLVCRELSLYRLQKLQPPNEVGLRG